MTDADRLAAKADAMIGYLLAELGQAREQTVRIIGELSLRDSRIKELEGEVAILKPTQSGETEAEGG